MDEIPEAVHQFWKGVATHDWNLIRDSISPDFVRIGMQDNEADTCRGRDDYVTFAQSVIGRFDHHSLETVSAFASADGRHVTHEAIETIQPPGQEPIVMRFANVMELDENGLITKLDIFWKTPPTMPPSWIAVDTVLSEG